MTNSARPEFSIVIPARDEEKTLPRCLDSIDRALAQAGAGAETIVIVNRCTDQTESVARARGCKIVANDARNLSMIRNAGARAAAGEIVVTVDADSRVSEKFFSCIREVMQSGEYVGGGVLILPERLSLGIIATGFMLAPIALVFGISAGSFYCRLSDFNAIGGFDESRVSAEDIDFARRLKAHGKGRNLKFKTLFRAYITTSCRKFDHFGDWYMLRHPRKWFRLWYGKDQHAANEIWYDTPRK